MSNEHLYRVAGWHFSLVLPESWSADRLLPAFRPFRLAPLPGEPPLFRLHVTVSDAVVPAAGSPLSDSRNDMGRMRLFARPGGYRFEVSYAAAGPPPNVLLVDDRFLSATATLHPAAAAPGAVVSSMLRILFAQAVLPLGGISLHASAVVLDGLSRLFLGKSGTGKSTHARMWTAAFPAAFLLNDDNPVVRMEDGALTAYGTPWSGKTPCYLDEGYPVAGIVRLQQAAANRFLPQTDADAFAALLPSCSVIRHDARLRDALCSTLVRIAEQVPVGRMECTPLPEAARYCHDALRRMRERLCS